MMCPHCGADAGTMSFCPSCSRLVRSPLLGMHRDLAASRGTTYGAERIAAAAAARAREAAGEAPLPRVVPPPPAEVAHPQRVMTDAMRKALDRRERKARGTAADDDGGSASADARAMHTSASHTVDDTSTPPPVPAQPRQAATPAPAPDAFRRPPALSVLVGLNALAGVILLGLAASLLDGEHLRPMSPETLPRYLAGGFGLAHLLTALGLRGMHPFGRVLQKLIALAWLFLVPLGTVYSLLLFGYFAAPGVKLLFSGRSPRSLTAKELATVRASEKWSPAMAVALFALAFLPALAIASFAASGLPVVVDLASKMFATGGAQVTPADPETAARDDVAALMRAEAAYASLGPGLYDRIECVLAPAACLTSDDPRSGELLDARFAEPERNGYLFRLVLGGRPDPRPAGASATGVTAYAYVATPVSGSGRAFCGDHTGALVQLDPADAAQVIVPRCPEGPAPPP